MSHVHKLPSGKWRVIVKVGGRQRTASAPTKAGARQLGAELALELGRIPRANDVTLAELLETHIAEQGYSASKVYDLNLILARLPDDVLAWRVTDTDKGMITILYRQLQRAGWTSHRVRTLHVLLSSAWNRATENGWASHNILVNKQVKKPATAPSKVKAPPRDAIVKVLAEVDRGVVVYLKLAANCGARRGEMIGLQWGDITSDSLRICRSVSYIPGIPKPVVTSGTVGGKNHDRTLALDPVIGDVLAKWRRDQVELALRSGSPSPVWVFSHDAGISMWRGDYITREFRLACARAKVTGVRLHDLRHHMATTWLSNNEAPAVVAGRLGHASVATTLSIYADFLPGADRAGALRQADDLTA